jgi:hypothetical protein
MTKKIDKQELEWIEYLIGKITADQLGEANKLRLEQQQAVKEAQKIVGDDGWWIKPDFLILDDED